MSFMILLSNLPVTSTLYAFTVLSYYDVNRP